MLMQQNVVWPVSKYSTEDFGLGLLTVCDEVKIENKHFLFYFSGESTITSFSAGGWLGV